MPVVSRLGVGRPTFEQANTEKALFISKLQNIIAKNIVDRVINRIMQQDGRMDFFFMTTVLTA